MSAAVLSHDASAQTRERVIYASVCYDAGGQPKESLRSSRPTFWSSEDGATREVLRVAPATEPMQIAVLVDNSQAARSYIRDLRAGSKASSPRC